MPNNSISIQSTSPSLTSMATQYIWDHEKTKQLIELMNSTQYSNKEALALVRLKANPNVWNRDGYSLLDLFVQSAFAANIKELVNEYGADINIKGKEGTPLQYIMNDRTNFFSEKVEDFINLNADLNVLDKDGYSLLHVLAFMHGYFDRMASSEDGSNFAQERNTKIKDAIQKLITQHGMDINIKNPVNGVTLLRYVIENPVGQSIKNPFPSSKIEFLDWLLAQGAELSFQEINNGTASSYSVSADEVETLKWLNNQKAASYSSSTTKINTRPFNASASTISSASSSGTSPLPTAQPTSQPANASASTISSASSSGTSPLPTAQPTSQPANASASTIFSASSSGTSPLPTAQPTSQPANASASTISSASSAGANPLPTTQLTSQSAVPKISQLLSELKLFDSIKTLPTDPKAPENQNFSQALLELANELNTDLLSQEEKIDQKTVPPAKADYSSTQKSGAGRIARYTLDLLQELDRPGATPQAKLRAIRQYEDNCKGSPGWMKFMRGLALVCFAAVGFVVGAAIGMGLGMAMGAWSGPGAFVTAALGAASGALQGLGLCLTTVSALLSGYGAARAGWAILFKPQPEETAALKALAVSEAARAKVSAEQQLK